MTGWSIPKMGYISILTDQLTSLQHGILNIGLLLHFKVIPRLMFALPYIYVSLLAISANFWLGTVAAQQWLPNGPTEYSARCALGTELSGEYICFTYYNDIRSAASGGVYQGYANASGTGELAILASLLDLLPRAYS